ncbi:MAG: hypothetical protein ACI88A_001856 [Paraglaciecola sp.]|jgi:hypothetical protein
MFKFSLKRLRDSHEGPWLFVDLSMLFLLVVNLLWILLDSLFATEVVQSNLTALSPAIVPAYMPLHRNFALIDLVFVSIFLIEFCIRWAAAVSRKEYIRWYFYPFIHWYDLIGCIPLSGVRVLRLLRIFSILYRLHKYQIIDLRNTALYRFMMFYYNVFVEELSDRIVIKVLSDAQQDLAAGSPLIDDISRKVLATRRHTLNEWAAAMLVHIGDSIADQEHGETVREHVKQSVGHAVRKNDQVSTLRLIPVLGGKIEVTLENAVTGIVTQSIINLLQDITPDKLDNMLKHGLNKFSTEEKSLDSEVLLIINECIELIKEHVGQQQWKGAFNTDPQTTNDMSK